MGKTFIKDSLLQLKGMLPYRCLPTNGHLPLTLTLPSICSGNQRLFKDEQLPATQEAHNGKLWIWICLTFTGL